MPWVPELFTRRRCGAYCDQRRRDRFVTVPFFDGLLAGEMDALVGSFAGEPELHHPVRGRIKGYGRSRRIARETQAWLTKRNVSVDDVAAHRRRATRLRGGAAALRPSLRAGQRSVAVVSDRQTDGRIDELRMYFSSWPITGRHANRPPLLQRDPELRESDVVAEYQRALAAGDVDAIVATFEPDGYAREPAGGAYVHSGPDGLRAHYELLFSGGGGIPLEHCTAVDDGQACALEYNVVQWGATELPPQAGVAVYVRGQSGKLAAARIYDDVDPPVGQDA